MHLILSSRSESRGGFRSLLRAAHKADSPYLLFGSPVTAVPERLFECVHRPHKIAGLDLSFLGEVVGCGLPDIDPPRNDRTNKALRVLGWNVHVRSPNQEAT